MNQLKEKHEATLFTNDNGDVIFKDEDFETLRLLKRNNGNVWLTIRGGVVSASKLTGCPGLRHVEFVGTIIIGSGAFKKCKNLETITLSDNLITINHAAFEDCASLNEIVAESRKVKIDFGAFDGCYKLNRDESRERAKQKDIEEMFSGHQTHLLILNKKILSWAAEKIKINKILASKKTFINVGFEGVEFDDGIFMSCEFIGCSFTDCHISRTEFGHSQFTCSDLTGTEMKELKLDSVRISDCNLSFVDINDYTTTNSVIVNSDMRGATVPDGMQIVDVLT